MLFNSLGFLVFFPCVVMLYWILPSKARNPMLLLASYYFYMNWQPVYALLILISTLTTWGCALMMGRGKKYWLVICIAVNIGILFFFKYFRFVGEILSKVLNELGVALPMPQFELLLPVGISFYTFQAIGYIIDVYRGELKAERNFITYALFVSFFPQLVAGPIERAGNLLPQFHKTHFFNGNDMIAGLRMMIWGYFMKLCIADQVAPYVNAVFGNVDMHNGKSIWMATFFFSFQIFCDFAGYSLIALGCAKCLGFRLMQNFRQPYLAHNVRDFWRRWHISLSTWFSDYVYKPLGGNRKGHLKHHRNLMLTFLISGLWHGANLTFLVWGAYHGFLQSLYVAKARWLPDLKLKHWLPKTLGILLTFFLVMIGWVLFRANNLHDAVTAWHKMFHPSGTLFFADGKPTIILPLLMILLLIWRELANEFNLRLQLTGNARLYMSGFSSGLLVLLILLCANFNGTQFLYFQF